MTNPPPYPEGFEGFQPPADYPPADATLPAATASGATPGATPDSTPTVRPPAYPGYPAPGYPEFPGYAAPPGYVPPGQYQPTPYPAYPTYGYQVPGGAPMYDVTGLGTDPLVTPPGQGFSGWWSRLWQTFARSWRSLLLIALVTVGLPGAVLGIFVARASIDLSNALQTQQDNVAAGAPAGFPSGFFVFLATTLVVAFIESVFSSMGWGASIWTVTRQAAGQPAPFGSAMIYGLKNFPRVFGWLFLYELMVGLGVVCCLLPGLYFAVAGSMIVPLVIFSRGSISDSWRMVNKNFGAALGRVLAAFGLEIAIVIVASVVSSILKLDGGFSGAVAGEAVSAVLAIPGTMILIIGVTLTYAELRAKEMLTTTPMLNQAL